MTFLELAKRLRQECGYQGEGPPSVLAQTGDLKRFVDWINLAYLTIQNKWTDWMFLWAEGEHELVPGQALYDPPSDFGAYNEDAIYLLQPGFQPTKLDPIAYDVYRREKGAFSGEGTPMYFTIQPNEKLRILPTPSAEQTVSFEYWRAAHTLVGNEAVPLIPVRYRMAIVWLARVYWAQFDDAQAEVQSSQFLYQQMLKDLEANQLPSREKMHSRAQGTDIRVVPQ